MSVDGVLEWNLEEIFPSQDGGHEFFKLIDSIRGSIVRLKGALQRHEVDEIVAQWQMISACLRHGFSYVACLGVQDQLHPRLQDYQLELIELEKEYSRLSLQVEVLWAEMSDESFEAYVGKKEHAPYSNLLRQRRTQVLKRMDSRCEHLALALCQESFMPLADLYKAIVSRLAVHVPDESSMDVFTAQTLMREQEPVLREKIFFSYEACWRKQGPIFRGLINQVYGYRCAMLKARKMSEPLQESLDLHRVKHSSVDSMWRVVNDKKGPLVLFLNKKASFYKRKKPAWTDIWADLIQENKTPLRIQDASNWVQASLSRLGTEVGQFARSLLSQGAISTRGLQEISISSCTLPLPLKRSVRVFLGYSDGIERLIDYTRQMASAWRYHILFDLPEILQHCPLVVCEALSAFCERLTLEIVKERAFTRQQQFDAHFSHMQRAAVYVLDMQTRYIFESRLFAERMNGPLSEDKLCELMVDAQKLGYAGQLGQYFPYYWATKDHFYHTTSAPFQNYALSMGFLMGLGLYQIYRKHPQGFCDTLKSWVRHSAGCESLESSFSQFFGINLEEEKLWAGAFALLEEDVREVCDLMDIKDRTFSLEMKGL